MHMDVECPLCGRKVAYLFSLPDIAPSWRGCAECVRKRRLGNRPAPAPALPHRATRRRTNA